MRSFPKIEVTPGAYIALALAILILPLRWLMAALTAGAVHELGHLLACQLCGGNIRSITIAPSGARIETAPMEQGRALFCSLAGPLLGLSLLVPGKWFPRLAICAGIQSVYNLLPLHPLDGGQALERGAEMLLPKRTARRFCTLTEFGCIGAILLAGIYGSFILRLGILPLLLAGLPVFQKKTLQRRSEGITIDLPKNSEVRL